MSATAARTNYWYNIEITNSKCDDSISIYILLRYEGIISSFFSNNAALHGLITVIFDYRNYVHRNRLIVKF